MRLGLRFCKQEPANHTCGWGRRWEPGGTGRIRTFRSPPRSGRLQSAGFFRHSTQPVPENQETFLDANRVPRLRLRVLEKLDSREGNKKNANNRDFVSRDTSPFNFNIGTSAPRLNLLNKILANKPTGSGGAGRRELKPRTYWIQIRLLLTALTRQRRSKTGKKIDKQERGRGKENCKGGEKLCQQ